MIACCGKEIEDGFHYAHSFECKMCDKIIYTGMPNHCPQCYFVLKIAHDGEYHKSIDLI